MVIFYTVSFSSFGLFFVFLFILLIIQGASSNASVAVLSFLDQNIVTIAIVFGLLTLLATALLSFAYKNSEKVVEKRPPTARVVAFAIGAFLLLTQFFFVLYQLIRSPFDSGYGSFLTIFAFIIAIILFIINSAITYAALGLAYNFPLCILLMYLWSILGAVIFGDLPKVLGA